MDQLFGLQHRRNTFRILETYIVFQTIRWPLHMINHGDFTMHSLISYVTFPQPQLWYLLSLFYWRIMVMVIPQSTLARKPFLILATCFFISLFGGFIPVNHMLSVQRTLTFLPFFFMGYYSTEINIKNYIKSIHIFASIATLSIVFLLYYFLFDFDIKFALGGKTSYWSYPLLPVSPFLVRCICLATATILGISLMRIVLAFPFQSILSKLGSKTLVIYIYHGFVIWILKILVTHNCLPGNEMLLFIYAIIITLGLYFLSRYKPFIILLNPISWYRERKSKN